MPEPEPEPEPHCAAYWRSPIPGMLSPLYGKLALRILGGLAHFRRKPTELAIRTDAPAHRRLSLPSATQEPVHHAPCSLRLSWPNCCSSASRKPPIPAHKSMNRIHRQPPIAPAQSASGFHQGRAQNVEPSTAHCEKHGYLPGQSASPFFIQEPSTRRPEPRNPVPY